MSVYLLQTTFGSCTCTGEMGEPFPVYPGIERRGRPSHSGMGSGQVTHMPGMTPVRGPITGINWHMSDVECDDILSYDCKYRI